jgi:hypothetical protein
MVMDVLAKALKWSIRAEFGLFLGLSLRKNVQNKKP